MWWQAGYQHAAEQTSSARPHRAERNAQDLHVVSVGLESVGCRRTEVAMAHCISTALAYSATLIAVCDRILSAR